MIFPLATILYINSNLSELRAELTKNTTRTVPYTELNKLTGSDYFMSGQIIANYNAFFINLEIVLYFKVGLQGGTTYTFNIPSEIAPRYTLEEIVPIPNRGTALVNILNNAKMQVLPSQQTGAGDSFRVNFSAVKK